MLLSVTTFGFYCWTNRNNGVVEWHFDKDASSAAMSISFWNVSQQTFNQDRLLVSAIMRFCHQPEQIYMICERRLQFSSLYILWSQEQVVIRKN